MHMHIIDSNLICPWLASRAYTIILLVIRVYIYASKWTKTYIVYKECQDIVNHINYIYLMYASYCSFVDYKLN